MAEQLQETDPISYVVVEAICQLFNNIETNNIPISELEIEARLGFIKDYFSNSRLKLPTKTEVLINDEKNQEHRTIFEGSIPYNSAKLLASYFVTNFGLPNNAFDFMIEEETNEALSKIFPHTYSKTLVNIYKLKNCTARAITDIKTKKIVESNNKYNYDVFNIYSGYVVSQNEDDNNENIIDTNDVLDNLCHYRIKFNREKFVPLEDFEFDHDFKSKYNILSSRERERYSIKLNDFYQIDFTKVNSRNQIVYEVEVEINCVTIYEIYKNSGGNKNAISLYIVTFLNIVRQLIALLNNTNIQNRESNEITNDLFFTNLDNCAMSKSQYEHYRNNVSSIVPLIGSFANSAKLRDLPITNTNVLKINKYHNNL